MESIDLLSEYNNNHKYELLYAFEKNYVIHKKEFLDDIIEKFNK
jgi:hypothetical protein